MDLSVMVTSTVELLRQHSPWLTDKLGGAVATQAVKEIWDQIKTKLGSTAVQKVETQPDDSAQWEIFKAKLLLALDEDDAFREQIATLVKPEGDAGGISQTATGNENKQVGVKDSHDVRIQVK